MRAWTVAALALLALAGGSAAQELSLQEYGQVDGLRNLAVQALAQDASGFVWAGTQNGLYRLDGARFERIGLAEGLSGVSSLAVDGARLWIGTADALWLREDGRLQRLPARAGDPQAVAPAAEGVWIVDDGRLARLARAADGRWRREDVPEAARVAGRGTVRSVAAGADGALWFSCGDRICARLGGRYASWGPSQGVPADAWQALLLAADGSVWARGVTHVLQRPPGAAAFIDRTDGRDLPDPLGSYPLAEDAQHRIVGAARATFERWNGRGWERFGTASGLPAGGRIQALLSDREGGLWIGMLGAGVLRWRGYGQWENWSVAGGLPHDAVWRFARAGAPGRETLYAATGLGVAALDEATRRFVPLAPTAGQEIYALAADARGTLWAGSTGGTLWHWPAGTGAAPVSQALASAPSVSNIFVQRSGELWVGTDGGLQHRARDAAPAAPVTAVEPASAAAANDGNACETPDGTLWLAGDRGLRRLRAGRWDRPLDERPLLALACLRDGSVLVSGGADGLRRAVPAGDGSLRVLDATPPALRGLIVQALLEDRRGWWWVATDAGVLVGNGAAWRLLDQSGGLVWNDTSGGALFEDRDGSIWIGTSRGLSHVLAVEALFRPAASPTFLRAVRRGDRPLAADAPLQLAWSHEPLEIDLETPAYRDRAVLGMEYRLLGFDERWTRTEHLDVRLTGLPPGRYRFEARAVDRDLGLPSPGAGLDIEIDPPWWRTPAAAAAAALAVLLAGWSLARWRLRIHVLRERRLEAVVAERTRELEASREQLRELASRDALTGVWNRRALTEILAREALRCARERQPLAVALTDIDHFKRVNDTHGHPAGDAVLREFAARLAGGLRPYDAVGRYGGEEFVVVMPGLDVRRPEHRARLQALHARIAATPMAVGTVTCSFGVAGTDGAAAVDVDALVASADAALYRAKRAGRDRIEWADAG
jgi:diguanylate cyclase (GGDEF)-like protein